MKSVGQLLQDARKKQHYTLDQVASVTRIRADYLKALEHNKFDTLPSATFTKGFIRNYALAVGLKPDHALAVFRRDFDQNKQGHIIPRGLTHPLKTSSRFFHPKTTTLFVALIIFLVIGAYITSQILIFTQAPQITLTSPSQDIVVGTMVEVRGQTVSDATITVNNQPVSLNPEGEFKTTLDLKPGDHTLVIKAESRDGKARTLTKFITVQSPSN